MYHFCTIITSNYIPYALALTESLQRIKLPFHLHVLVCDEVDRESRENLSFYNLSYVLQNEFGNILFEKYQMSDELRWSLKPVFMSVLLKEQTDKIVYIDSDIHFYSDYSFIFQELSDYNILLTPHWRSFNPTVDATNFEKNFQEGMFNAGFLAASKQGVWVLERLAEMCVYKCQKNKSLGLFDDQKYFDMLPLLDAKVKVLRHKGCNVAEWNSKECPRIEKDNQVYIDEVFPIVFIHFVPYTIKRAFSGEDPLLKPYVQSYNDLVLKHHPEKYSVIEKHLKISNKVAPIKNNRFKKYLKTILQGIARRL